MNHVEQTIEELVAQARACEARAGDYRAMAVELGALMREVAGERVRKCVGEKVSGGGKGGQVTQVGAADRNVRDTADRIVCATVAKVKRGYGTLLDACVAGVAGLKEPFGRDDVMRAAGAEKKRAENWLTRAFLKGWVKRLGHGVYERTGKFPKGEGKKVSGGESGKVSGGAHAARAPGDREKEGALPEPSERERRYGELREGMGKIHVPRIGEGMRPDGDEET